MMPGGTKPPKPVDDEARNIAHKAKGDIEAKAGKSFSTFEPTEYSTQVVAGTNFFFKIHVGNNEYIHARVFRDLQQNVSVHSVKTGLGASEGLQYF